MKNSKEIALIVVFCCLLCIFLTGCNNPLIDNNQTIQLENNVIRVSFTTSVNQRSSAPDLSSIIWSVVAENQSTNKTYNAKQSNNYWLFSEITKGSYKISIQGKLPDGTICYKGSTNVTYSGNKGIDVVIPLEAQDYEVSTEITISFEINEQLNAYLSGTSLSDCKLSVIAASEFETSPDPWNSPSIENGYLVFKGDLYNKGLYKLELAVPRLSKNPLYTNDSQVLFKLYDDIIEVVPPLTTNVKYSKTDYFCDIYDNYRNYFIVSDEANEELSEVILQLTSPEIVYNPENNQEDDYKCYAYFKQDIKISNLSEYIFELHFYEDTILDSFGNIKTFEFDGEDQEPKTVEISDDFCYLGYCILKDIIVKGKNFKLSDNSLRIERNVKIIGNTTLDCIVIDDSAYIDLQKGAKLSIGSNFDSDSIIKINLIGNWKVGDTVLNLTKLTDDKKKNVLSKFVLSTTLVSPETSITSTDKTDWGFDYYINDNGILCKENEKIYNIAWTKDSLFSVSEIDCKNMYAATEKDQELFISSETESLTKQSFVFDSKKNLYINDYNTNTNSNYVALYKIDNKGLYSNESSNRIIDDIQMPIYVDDSTGKTFLYGLSSDSTKLRKITLKEDLTVDSSVEETTYDITKEGSDNILALNDSFLVQGNDVYIAKNLDTNVKISHYELTGSDSLELKNEITPTIFTLDENEVRVCKVNDMFIDGEYLCVLYAEVQSGASDYFHGQGGLFKFRKSDLSTVTSWNTDSSKTHFRNEIKIKKGEYKKDFLLPRKIVAIRGRKLVIVDDGVSCIDDGYDYKNINRFVYFDLDTATFDTLNMNQSLSEDFSITNGTNSDDSILESHDFYQGSYILY